ncbi:Polysaccharide biosynthesis protein OS=Tsukamurella paurometabola (strain ATCC 8368 / DSM /CCUG 35730 / CIP 100753 / JCM 10117 / KCTC 9821 / NBRC 16120/ NCIMB 702349 / NCTC 13040) OX=521096 GN=Tpau_0061 PE=4 SV=1 [Tsukamurella paurometabola]|uniref:Polysaccharide biosynthesis protein n=1 Tax=Tsukamurella paurometabola (strain ATCC 8368 / DSM 20162 / CCUG 35730 / CIP 100753 / JCM 10117 / KCTC 9821 / NBRC 16120 / NCIMB 702349 / NCTC 13040) TaxID=521096 RepID=D5UPU7_TSUPD|nr:polysaccharide biosynthesis protein [Tsukamurella paurometabola DSM 20162]SUP41331.1 colanic acid exporter [Tsukamurella paurometabola]
MPDYSIATEVSGSESGTAQGRASSGRIARAFGVQMVARVVGLMASIVTMALTSRHLGLTSYGHLQAAIAFVGLWTSFTELGIGAVIVRRVTSGLADLSQLVRVSVGLSIAYCVPLGALTLFMGWGIYSSQGSEVVAMIAIVAVSLILTTLSSCFQPIFMTNVQFGAVAASDVVGRVLSLAGTVWLISIDAPLVWFAAVQIVPPLVALVIQAIAARRLVEISPVFSVGESWHLIRESLPQTGVLIIAALYWRSDAFLLSILSTPQQLGAYSLAYGIAFNATVISATYLASALSTMTNLWATDRDEFARFTVRSMQAMLFLGTPMVAIGLTLAPGIIHLISDSEFVEIGSVALGLLFIAVALRFVNAVLSQALFAAHDQVFLLRLNVVNLIGNIVLNVILIPPFGAAGAGIALIASETVGLLVATWRLTRRSPYRTPWRFCLHLLVPLGATVGVCLALDDVLPVLVTAMIAGVVFLAVNLALGPVHASAIRELLARGGEPDARDDESSKAPPTSSEPTSSEGNTR